MANFSSIGVGMPFGPTARQTSAELPLGTIAFDSLGNEYRYVKAGAAIAAKEAVMFAGSTLGWDDVRKTSGVNVGFFGVATAAFASADYGFVQTRGVATILTVDSTAAKSALVPSATAGTLKLATEAESLAGAKSATALTSAADTSTAGAVVAIL